MESVKISINERAQHKRQYDRRVNKRLMQTQESKVVSSKAVDVDLVIMESNGTKSKKQDTSSSSRNYFTHVVDADIRPVNDQIPFAEVQLTAQHNVLANEQQHTEQSEPIYDTYLLEKIDINTTPDSTNMSHMGGEIDQDAEQYQCLQTSSRDVQPPGSSRNSQEESYGSNDMAHNHYLEEARKKTQERNRNSKSSVMHTTSLQITTNGSKQKLRSNNQTSKSLPVSKSSDVTSNSVPLVDHSRNSSSFSLGILILNKVNSHAKVQSPKIRNNNPVEPKNHTHKPGRQNGIGQRFSLNKSSAVHEKPHTPRSCLRWKPTGRIFKTVSLRWIPTGKMFTDSTTKVDSEPPNGSNDDITNPYECNQTLYFSAGTSNSSAGTSVNPLKERLRGIHCISKFPSIYIQLFWNTLTHDAKTGRSLLHDNIVPKPDLALELGKSISLTEAEEEAVAREVHATHARIVSGPDPEPMQEDQTGSNSGKLHVSLAGPNPEHMDDEFLATAYPKVHENLKLITDERVIEENPESHSGSMSSMKNLDDTYNFGDQFLYDKPTEDDQEKSKVIEESDSTIPDPSHQTVTSTPPVIAPFTDVSSTKPSSLVTPPPINTEATKWSERCLKSRRLITLPMFWLQSNPKFLRWEKQDSIYSSGQQTRCSEEFGLKRLSSNTCIRSRMQNKNPAYYHLYHALMEALIADEDAMDKEFAVKVKDLKRKRDSDDEKRSSDSSKKVKGIQTLTPAEQEVADIMKALKESKKMSKRKPRTGGSNEGTGNILGVPDESTVISRASSEGTGSKLGVPDEEKLIL
ncbi:hypothetical protein Tco_0079216 [Tanacetum coccineum]